MNKELKHIRARHEEFKALDNITIDLDKMFELLSRAVDDRTELLKMVDAQQARIDMLMLEYCPDDMTPEQMAVWGENQVEVTDFNLYTCKRHEWILRSYACPTCLIAEFNEE